MKKWTYGFLVVGIVAAAIDVAGMAEGGTAIALMCFAVLMLTLVLVPDAETGRTRPCRSGVLRNADTEAATVQDSPYEPKQKLGLERVLAGAIMKVRNVMTRGIEGIDSGCSASDAAVKMKRLNVGILPVMDNGRIIGAVTDRDLVIRVLAEPGGARWTPIVEAMSHRAVSIDEESDMEQAIRLMSEQEVSRLFVQDQSGQVVGLLSIADIEAEGLSNWAAELHKTLGAKYRNRHIHSLAHAAH